MTATGGTDVGASVREPVTLSTGHTVELPVRTWATMLGATFAAPEPAVSELLPEGLRPIRATPAGDAYFHHGRRV